MNPSNLSCFCFKPSGSSLAVDGQHSVAAKKSVVKMRFLLWESIAVVLTSVLLSGFETPGQSAVAGAATGAAAEGLLKGTSRGAPVYSEPPAPVSPAYVQTGPVYVPAPEQKHLHQNFDSSFFSHWSQYVFRDDKRWPESHDRHPVLVARPAADYGYVYSPYTGSLVNVRGIQHGAEVVDPSSGKVFINP